MSSTQLLLGLNTMGPTANFGFWGGAGEETAKAVRLAEELGFHSVWTAEAYGTDAITPLAWLAGMTETIGLGTGVLQIPARTPAMTAMTAATLDNLSNGRLILGLGASGAAVVEGWHNQAYQAPLAHTEEYVRVVRRMLSRKAVLHRGQFYEMPFRGEGATGTAKPMQLSFRPKRAHLPIYLAAMGPQNLRLASRIANGVLLPWFSPFRAPELFGDLLPKFGAGKTEVAAFVPAAIGPHLDRCLDMMRPILAFWLGGMGSGTVNHYNSYAQRLGFDGIGEVQRLYREGRTREAVAAVPLDLVDEVTLCGPEERIAERLDVWAASPARLIILTGANDSTMRTMAAMVASR